jgi:hypothetical protein
VAPQDDAPDEPVTEHNFFRDTLQSARSTVRTCGENVYAGHGSPLDAIAEPLSGGGWVCTEADDFVAEMTGQCAGITAAFDDAVADISARLGTEEARVPEHDWRGVSWNRSWAHRHNY